MKQNGLVQTKTKDNSSANKLNRTNDTIPNSLGKISKIAVTYYNI